MRSGRGPGPEVERHVTRKIHRSPGFYVLVAVVVLFVVYQIVRSGPDYRKLSLSDFQAAVSQQQVKSAKLYDKDHVIKGVLIGGGHYKVTVPDQSTDEISDELLHAQPPVDLEVDNQKDPLWLGLLFQVLPFILLVG